ncbi:GNAT family N-acetyltransferase [Glaciecola siphonariae]|uniref:GNAT family N-acetyltransferase n=1 Tax=Glaciecola siphonariae TaxID=521012 RepID=A0ABV9LQ70_9ALTE
MLHLRQGVQDDGPLLAKLILLSADTLLPYLFGSSAAALEYLEQASRHQDGQYSALRHRVAVSNNEVIGCMSLWHDDMPDGFRDATVQSLTDYLDVEQLAHIVVANQTLGAIFKAPTEHELCIGHLAVAPDWQRKNVGSKLIAYAQAQAKALNKTHLVLDADIAKTSALGFYQRHGFEIVRRYKHEPTDQRFARLALAL